MDPEQMEQLFRTHRDAEKRRDFDGIMQTFTEDCYLETIALGSRSEGQAAAVPPTSPTSQRSRPHP